MLGVWIAAVALAGDVDFAVPHSAAPERPLFAKAMLSTVRGTARGGDCAAAIHAAAKAGADALGEGAVLLRVVRSPSDYSPLDKTTCRQRMAGDNVSASVVEVSILTMIAAAPSSRYPVVSEDRAVQIASVITEISPEGATLAIAEVADALWVVSVPVVEPAVLDASALDSNQRGALIYERYVSPWVVRWARALEAVPEVAGASLEITVSHEDPRAGKNPKKTRKSEIFRFLVPTAAALAFARGDLTDDALVSASRVERATDLKRRDFLQFLLDLEDAGQPSETDRGITAKSRDALGTLDNIDITDDTKAQSDPSAKDDETDDIDLEDE